MEIGVHYRVHKYPPRAPILSRVNPFHVLLSFCFFKLNFNIIPHPRLGLPSGLFPSDLPNETLHAPLPSPIRATWPAHLILNLLT
jgi:hypothetical protein